MHEGVGAEGRDEGFVGDRRALERVGVQTPAAHPGSAAHVGPGVGDARAQRPDEFAARPDGGQVDAGSEHQAHDRVHVPVDEARGHGGGAEVDDLGVLPPPAADVGPVADGGDPPVGDGDGLGVRPRGVQRVDGVRDDDELRGGHDSPPMRV